MFAEIANSSLGNAVLIGFTVASGVSTVVSLVSLFATRREVEAIQARIDQHERIHQELFQQMDGVESGMRDELRADLATLRASIGEASASVAGLVATVNQLNQSLAAQQARVDRLAERGHGQ